MTQRPTGGASVDVSIILVTYNSAHVIESSLKSLPVRPDVQVIVVDNNSSDDTIDVVAAAMPSAEIVPNPNNDGFARAVNLGAESATGQFILLLNPDAEIDAYALDTLTAGLREDDSIGISAPFVTDPDGEFFAIAAGYSPTIWRMGLHASGVSRLGRAIPALEGHYLFRGSRLDDLRDLDWVSGGCLLVRRSVWTSIGGLSERWFMYAEDVDLCLRVRKLGLRVVLNPGAIALHSIGGSSKDVEGRVNPQWIVNLFDLYCIDVAKSAIACRIWKATVMAGFIGRATVYRVLVRARPENKSAYKAHIHRYGVFARALSGAKSTYSQRRR